MSATTEEMTITYAGITIGGSTARKIDSYTKDEDEYVNGAFEFEFITTALTDVAFTSELETLRAAFRTPRQDLLVTQNGSTYLSRKHSDNTGLNTNSRILKDGDPADTGRSHHFRIRIEYERPADNVSTNFRRGSTVNVQYTPSRRRTTTISGIYTANSTSITTALAQYSAQIAAYEASELDVIDSSVDWERVGEPQVEFFETNKVLSFTRSYREVNYPQTLGLVDDPDIIDPQLTITRERMAPGDSVAGRITISAGISNPGGTQPASSQGGNTFQSDVKRPVLVRIDYTANINFQTTQDLQTKWIANIKPFLINRAKSSEGSFGAILIDEQVAFDKYENRITAKLELIDFNYDNTLLSSKITHRDTTVFGMVLFPTSSSDPFEFYEFQGPVVRQRIVTEEYEKLSPTQNVRNVVDDLIANPGSTTNFGEKWILVSREPTGVVLRKGLNDTPVRYIAEIKIETVLQFRNRKAPSKANAGGVTGSDITG